MSRVHDGSRLPQQLRSLASGKSFWGEQVARNASVPFRIVDFRRSAWRQDGCHFVLRGLAFVMIED